MMHRLILGPLTALANPSLSLRAAATRFVRLLVIALALSATGARADIYADCEQGKDPDRSIGACTQVIERGDEEAAKNRAIAYNNRGNAYLKKGDTDKAIADYSQAIALDPKYAKAYSSRGVAYYNKGEVDRAIADYSQAIALNPNDLAAYFNRGLAHEKKGNTKQAVADYRKTLEIEPSDQDAKDGLKRLGVTP